MFGGTDNFLFTKMMSLLSPHMPQTPNKLILKQNKEQQLHVVDCHLLFWSNPGQPLVISLPYGIFMKNSNT